ncbi:RidA family protein [Sinanaerobacter chloroacetimidivorans]|jgi:2-iminobutanoate/2-iminopropanoate deaminase|uniref:RidA family protein n=1 Tax=Sinanaerobacter chloroacetimidivorans TaxID=2818044 RepID=A0A8J7VZP0_9FIRM|nr:RidA family protein [Sinanaerobacter chloroacetimidivorans]MBR0598079.1 RidA family protein [Sinanaerobacter chloroacetimidivorans]
MKQKAIFNEKTLGEVHGPYVQGTKYRDLFFTTQIATLQNGDIISLDPYEQALQTLRNAELALKEVGGTLADVLTCRIYLTDMNDYAAVNKAYRELMPNDPFPTRACVQVAGMIPEVKVEMEFICSVPE